MAGYPKLIELLDAGTLNWVADDIRIMLVNETYTYDRTHDFVNDVSATELSGGSYARQVLASKTSADNGTNRWVWDAADPTFTAVAGGQTAGGAIVFKQVTDDTDSPILVFLDPADLVANGSDITVNFSATDGVFYIGYL